MIKITSYVNGHFEALESCASIADYADSHDLMVDDLKITMSGVDNWQIEATLLPMYSEYMNKKIDDIPF